MWRFRICPEAGTINEIDVVVGSIGASMMDTLEENGYKWASSVDGKTEMTYTVDRVR